MPHCGFVLPRRWKRMRLPKWRKGRAVENVAARAKGGRARAGKGLGEARGGKRRGWRRGGKGGGGEKGGGGGRGGRGRGGRGWGGGGGARDVREEKVLRAGENAGRGADEVPVEVQVPGARLVLVRKDPG